MRQGTCLLVGELLELALGVLQLPIQIRRLKADLVPIWAGAGRASARLADRHSNSCAALGTLRAQLLIVKHAAHHLSFDLESRQANCDDSPS